MTTCIRASYARLALTCKADVDIRYYLRGIEVQPREEGGVYIAATNGHSLIAIIDPTGTCDEPSIILSPNGVTSMLLPKVGSRNDTEDARLELVRHDDKPALLLKDKLGLPVNMQLSDAVIEGRFPTWRTSVLPDFSKLEKGSRSAFNLDYLQRPLEAIAKGGKAFAAGVESFQEASDRAVTVWRFAGHDNVMLMIMPMNDNSIDPVKRSAWLNTFAKAKRDPASPPAAAAPATTEAQPA
jgi:hypothetical protein